MAQNGFYGDMGGNNYATYGTPSYRSPQGGMNMMPAVSSEANVPETIQSELFIPGFLQTQIGKLMRVEFLIGGNTVDRVGILRAVGASYILLQPVGQTDTILCDLFSVKFVTIVNRQTNGEVVVV